MSLYLFIHFQYQKSYMKLHPIATAMLLQASNLVRIIQKLNILQNSHKKNTHEVSGHLGIILPNFTLPATKQELSVPVKLETLIHKKKHIVGLKMPLEGSTSNLMPFRHCLTQKTKVAAKLALPVATSLKALDLQLEPMDDLKILSRGSISSFRSN